MLYQGTACKGHQCKHAVFGLHIWQQAQSRPLQPLPCTAADLALGSIPLAEGWLQPRVMNLGRIHTMLMHRLKDTSSLGLSCTYAKPLHDCRGLLADTVPSFSGISSTLSTVPNDSNLWPTWLDDTLPGRPLSHKRTGLKFMTLGSQTLKSLHSPSTQETCCHRASLGTKSVERCWIILMWIKGHRLIKLMYMRILRQEASVGRTSRGGLLACYGHVVSLPVCCVS